MVANSNDQAPAAADSPLQDFSNCHEGILDQFEQFSRLPGLLDKPEAAREVQQIAADMYRFFRDVVLEHHEEEEQELFTAVMRSAEPGEEAAQARAMIDRLVAEHRQVEAMWKRVERHVKRLAKGKAADIDRTVVAGIAELYLAHARFEEDEFLPLSARILSKNDQSALGLSLHMRHSVKNVRGYI